MAAITQTLGRIRVMKNLTLTLLFALTLASCGSKKDDPNDRNQIGQLGNNGNQTRQTQMNQNQAPREQEELLADTSEELYLKIKKSGLDMDQVRAGQEVLIKCDSGKMLNEMGICRLGFSERELQIGGGAPGYGGYLTKGHTEEIHDSIYSQSLRDSLMDGDVLLIKCSKTCSITDGYEGTRELVDHRARGYGAQPQTNGF